MQRQAARHPLEWGQRPGLPLSTVIVKPLAMEWGQRPALPLSKAIACCVLPVVCPLGLPTESSPTHRESE